MKAAGCFLKVLIQLSQLASTGHKEGSFNRYIVREEGGWFALLFGWLMSLPGWLLAWQGRDATLLETLE